MIAGVTTCRELTCSVLNQRYEEGSSAHRAPGSPSASPPYYTFLPHFHSGTPHCPRALLPSVQSPFRRWAFPPGLGTARLGLVLGGPRDYLHSNADSFHGMQEKKSKQRTYGWECHASVKVSAVLRCAARARPV